MVLRSGVPDPERIVRIKEGARRFWARAGAIKGYIPRSPLLNYGRPREGEGLDEFYERVLRETKQEFTTVLDSAVQAYSSGEISTEELCRRLTEDVDPKRKEYEMVQSDCRMSRQ